MTQEYKDLMLDYLTGNISIETGDNLPQYSNVITTTTNLDTYISTYISDYSILGYLNYTDKYLLYGKYTLNSEEYGFLVIIDETFQPVQCITEFDSGTKLYPFEIMQYDENNYIFAVTGNKFIMLNNVLLTSSDTYTCKLRRTYNFPSSVIPYGDINYEGDGSNHKRNEMLLKSKNDSQYYILGYRYTTQGGTTYSFCVTTLKVNVGSSNVWGSYLINNNWLPGLTAYIEEGTNPILKIATYNNVFNGSLYNLVLKQYKLDISVETPSLVLEYSPTIYTDVNAGFSELQYIGSNKLYCSIFFYSSSNRHFEIYEYDFSAEEKTFLGDLELEDLNVIVPSPVFRLRFINGIVFFGVIYVNYNNGNIYKFATGIVYKTPKSTFMRYVDLTQGTYEEMYYNPLFIIQNSYNLYNLSFLKADNSSTTQVIYNVNNYNGESFTDINSLTPHSMVLSSADKIEFARNLYNMRINANTITSILEVPNTYLNNTTITGEDLYSKNNNVLDQQTETINTNIFETLYINTNDTWNMINRNDPLEPLTNKVGATRIVNSTAVQQDYDNAKAGVFRVVTSGGYYDRYINPSDISYDDGVYTYSFNFYGNPSITQIQILSYDKQTIYCTYDVSTQAGKIYTYTQEVTIE